MRVYDVNVSGPHCEAARKCERQGTFFYICFAYKDPTSAIMVTPLRGEEKDGMKLFHNTAGAVYPVKPGLIRRISLHQNSSFKLETTALVSAYAAQTQPLI